MGWTINDKTPEELGVTVAGWTEQPMSIDVLNLTAIVDYYTSKKRKGPTKYEEIAWGVDEGLVGCFYG